MDRTSDPERRAIVRKVIADYEAETGYRLASAQQAKAMLGKTVRLSVVSYAWALLTGLLALTAWPVFAVSIGPGDRFGIGVGVVISLLAAFSFYGSLRASFASEGVTKHSRELNKRIAAATGEKPPRYSNARWPFRRPDDD